MRSPVLARHLPPRIAMGAFILNSGLNKRGVDPETAQGMHGMAAGAYPFLKDMDPQLFVRNLSSAEIALGAALLIPFVPTRLVAMALAVFSGSLVGMYLRLPGMTEEGTVLPTEQGNALAKDVFMLGSALGMLIDESTRAARYGAKQLRKKVSSH